MVELNQLDKTQLNILSILARYLMQRLVMDTAR